MKFDDFDKKMRVFEESLDQYIGMDKYMVARLDGRSFSRLTKETCDFEAPFDVRFRDMMVDTVKAVMNCGFKVIYGYTESDEISLLFHRDENGFGRKVRKYNSTLAGHASAAFSLKLGQIATMDCRMIPLPEKNDVIDYFLWRQEDARRNALNSHCYWALRKEGFSGKAAESKLASKSTAYKTNILKDRKIDFDKLPLWQKNGTGLYWETVEKEGFNPITKEKTTAVRQRLITNYELPYGKAYALYIENIIE